MGGQNQKARIDTEPQVDEPDFEKEDEWDEELERMHSQMARLSNSKSSGIGTHFVKSTIKYLDNEDSDQIEIRGSTIDKYELLSRIGGKGENVEVYQ